MDDHEARAMAEQALRNLAMLRMAKLTGASVATLGRIAQTARARSAHQGQRPQAGAST